MNADDYGLTKHVSRAILDGMRDGIITDTSALVTAPGFEESASLALASGLREMGLHVLLTMGRPALPASEIPSLVKETGFFPAREEFLAKPVSIAEAEAEIEAQISKLERTGLRLNHMDCHHGLMNKSADLRELFITLALRHGVPIRNEASRYATKEIESRYRDKGVAMPEHLYFNHPGIRTHKTEHVLEYLDEAKERYTLVEIGCHPGYCDSILEQLSQLNRERERELAVFTDGRVKDFIRNHSIELVSYTEAFAEVERWI